MINVTKTYLPNFDDYTNTLKRAWDKAWITNNGELVLELEDKLKQYLGLNNLLFTNNGTIVLQMALKVLNITKDVITTPFSYVATTNAILWENCNPIFVDIDEQTLNIDANKIEAAITPNTQAILATHVYGIACNIEKIDAIAKKHNLKVIYDGAHSFGCMHNGKSLLSYGDISTCSFHATKIFHTVEGGCIIANDANVAHQLMLYRQFGHVYDDYFTVGVNAKNSEFHAAMGLCNLPMVKDIIAHRKTITMLYNASLSGIITQPLVADYGNYNFSYYPIIFETEQKLLSAMAALQLQQISGRRYFYPALNELPFVQKQPCPIAESISRRVLCLPLYFGLTISDATRVIECIIIANNLK